MIIPVLILTLLTGCALSGEKSLPVTILPDIPVDLLTCYKNTTTWPENKALTVGEVEKLWKTDRLSLIKLNDCYKRLVIIYGEAKQGVTK